MSATGPSPSAAPRSPVPPARLVRLMGACLCALALLLAGADLPAQNSRGDLTPRQDAERRYADKLLQRASQRVMAGQWRGARKDYRKAIESLTIAYGADDPRVAEVHMLLARTIYTQATRNRRRPGDLDGAGESLQAAMQIYENLAPPQPDRLLETYVYYGDYLILEDQPERATAMYQRGWDLLVAEASAATAADYFDENVRLFAGRLNGIRHEKNQLVWYRFTLGGDGRVHDIEDAGSDAQSRAMAEVREFLENSRFRPRLVDRMPQSVPAVAKLEFPANGTEPAELRQ